MKWIMTIIAVEALTQLICKAELFDRPREQIKSLGGFFKALLSCPYCVSVWSALLIIGLMIYYEYTFWFILLLVLHRVSNFLHDIYSILLQLKINLILKRWI